MAGPNLTDIIVLGKGDGTFTGITFLEGTYYPRIGVAGEFNSDSGMDFAEFSTSDTLNAVPQTLTVWTSVPAFRLRPFSLVPSRQVPAVRRCPFHYPMLVTRRFNWPKLLPPVISVRQTIAPVPSL